MSARAGGARKRRAPEYEPRPELTHVLSSGMVDLREAIDVAPRRPRSNIASAWMTTLSRFGEP